LRCDAVGHDRAGLEFGEKLTAAILTLLGTAAALATVAGAPLWLTIALTCLAVLGGISAVVLHFLRERERRREERASLWRQPPTRVSEAAEKGLFYELGVEFEAGEALAALNSSPTHAPYVTRDVDAEIRSTLRAAAARTRPTLVVVSGASKTGKSRTALEAAAAALPDAWLLSPRDAPSLARIALAPCPRDLETGARVIWLDDIEGFSRPGVGGLSTETLRAFANWPQPVIVLATHGGKGQLLAGPEAARFRDTTSDLLTRCEPAPFRLSPELTADETRRLEAHPHYANDVASRMAREGIGEFMIAAPRLVDRLEHERECPEGPAVTWAAIDCQRAGILSPLPVEWLREMFACYLVGAPSPDRFARGLDWATRPLYSRVAPLLRPDRQLDRYRAYDYLVEYAAQSRASPNEIVWDAVVDRLATGADDLLAIGINAYLAGSLSRAERAFLRADDLGSARAAYSLGVLLEQQGDLQGAEAAHRRGDERGSADAATNLGVLLHERGELEAAEAAYRRGDERGSPDGANNLGVLLAQRGDGEGAEAAWRRAEARSTTAGAARPTRTQTRGLLTEA
jgi:hypothetical protein